MTPRTVVTAFAGAVLAVVIGYFGGGFAHDLVGSGHEVAIGVVDAQAGVPVTTASPSPEPTPEASAEAPSPFASVAPAESPSPSPDGSFEPCPGTPPRDNCTCRQRKHNSRWICPLF